MPAAKAAAMSDKEKSSAVRRKRSAQSKAGKPGRDVGGGGRKPVRVSTKVDEEQLAELQFKGSECTVDCSGRQARTLKNRTCLRTVTYGRWAAAAPDPGFATLGSEVSIYADV